MSARTTKSGSCPSLRFDSRVAIALAVLMLVPGWAAVALDLRTRRVPTWLTALGLALAFGAAASREELAGAVVGAAVCGLLGFALVVSAPDQFVRGEAKLMAYGGAVAGATAVPWFLLWMGLCGGAIALLAIVRTHQSRQGYQGRRTAIPYTLAIVGGCSVAYVLGP